MDRGAWRATVHGVTKSWTWLSDRACTQAWQTEVWIESPKRGPMALNQFPVHTSRDPQIQGKPGPIDEKMLPHSKGKKKKIECKSSSLLDFKCPVALLSGWKPWGRKNNQILRIYGHWVKISVVHQKEQGASRSDKPQGLVSSPSHSSSPISVIFFLVLEWIIRNNV